MRTMPHLSLGFGEQISEQCMFLSNFNAPAHVLPVHKHQRAQGHHVPTAKDEKKNVFCFVWESIREITLNMIMYSHAYVNDGIHVFMLF